MVKAFYFGSSIKEEKDFITHIIEVYYYEPYDPKRDLGYDDLVSKHSFDEDEKIDFSSRRLKATIPKEEWDSVRVYFSDGDKVDLSKSELLELMNGEKSIADINNDIRDDNSMRDVRLQDIRLKDAKRQSMLSFIGGLALGAIGGIVGVNLAKK